MRNVFAATTALILLFALNGQAADGVFMVVKGDIKVQSKKNGEQKVKVGSKVQEGDVVIAGPDSRAKIVMVDKNVLNISPDTKIAIEKYKFDPDKDNKNVSLNVIYGKVRSTVNQKYDGEKNSFNIKTPSAVAGVRGTDFVTGFNPVTSTTKIVTFEGQVMTGSGMDATGKIMNAVAVNPGQFTVASAGAPPAPPVAVPKSELATMNNETKADTAASKGNDNNRAPADDGGKKGDKKGADKDGPKGADSSKKGPAPASMGVDSKDMTADSGPAPIGSVAPPPRMDCPACNNQNIGFPQQLPTELLNNGPTRLIINVQ